MRLYLSLICVVMQLMTDSFCQQPLTSAPEIASNVSSTTPPSTVDIKEDNWSGRKTIEEKSSVPRKGVDVPVEETVANSSSLMSLPADLKTVSILEGGEQKKDPSKPRKGATAMPDLADVKEPSKPRKGAFFLSNYTSDNVTATPVPVLKFKPTASGLQPTDEDESADRSSDLTTMAISGLSVGIILALILASVSYWRLRDAWSRRQYKRVDFLVEGMYVDS